MTVEICFSENIMGIENIDQELCTGCDACVDECPMDVIRFDDKKKKAYIAYGLDCGVCFLCTNACPAEAIKVTALTPRKFVLPY